MNFSIWIYNTLPVFCGIFFWCFFKNQSLDKSTSSFYWWAAGMHETQAPIFLPEAWESS